jgi:hypothetical protein
MENCESCKLPAETKYVEFHENIGMVFMRKHRSVKGNFCKPCIDYYFWNLTGKTMLVGWWGTISFIITPFILLNNILRFIFTIGMEEPPFSITPKPSLFWILSAVGGFLFGGFIISVFLFSLLFSSFAQPAYSQPLAQPTYSQPQIPTRIPNPTVNPSDLHITVSPPCISLDEVTPQMAGSEVCVCDVIADSEQNEQAEETYFYFGKKDQLFLRLDRLESPQDGKCVCVSGLVQLDANKTPYIEIDNNIGLCPY